jgi:hypothetical protein
MLLKLYTISCLTLSNLVFSITITKEMKGDSHTITRMPGGGIREDIDESVNIIRTTVPGDATPDDKEVEVTDPRVLALIEEDPILGGGPPEEAPKEPDVEAIIKQDTRIVHADNNGETRLVRTSG